jgi:dTDP-4-amino-4,6-dideoxy-D-galactose acyltransferase
MSNGVQVLEWDSDFFGFGVCRIEAGKTACLEVAVEDARKRGMKLLYWFVDPTDKAAPEAATAVGARLVDRKVTYLHDLTDMGEPTLNPHLTRAIDVTPQLRTLAIESGHYSRFKVDPGFAPGAFDQMYDIWLERSVKGMIAREVLVYKDSSHELGFVTLGVKNGRANIGLIAVDSNSRCKGIGAHLLKAAFLRAKEWGLSEITVVTQQDNIGACRFYERYGFVAETVEHIYHIWL